MFVLSRSIWAHTGGPPLFCSRSLLCSHAKSLNRLMTSGCLLVYCGRSVWVQILYDTYACRRRHCHSERHASYLPGIITSRGD